MERLKPLILSEPASPIAALMLVNMADIATTIIAMQRGLPEGNQIALALFQNMETFYSGKMLIMLGFAGLYHYSNQGRLKFLNKLPGVEDSINWPRLFRRTIFGITGGVGLAVLNNIYQIVNT